MVNLIENMCLNYVRKAFLFLVPRPSCYYSSLLMNVDEDS